MLLSSRPGNSHEFCPISQIRVTELLGHVSALPYGSKQTRGAVVEQTKEGRKNILTSMNCFTESVLISFSGVDIEKIQEESDKFEGYMSGEWDVYLPKTLPL